MIVRLHDFQAPHESDWVIELAGGAGIGQGTGFNVTGTVRVFDAETLKEVARQRRNGYWYRIGPELVTVGHGYKYCDVEEQA